MFWKFQANGNDFVLIHKKEWRENPKDLAPLLCRRQFGIGADGLLAIDVQEDEIFYEHVNADGSPADLCVNGIRCVGLWYFQHNAQQKVTITIAKHSYTLSYIDHNEVMVVVPLPETLGDTLYRCGVLHEMVETFPDEKKTDRNYDIIERIDEKSIHVSTWERGVGKTLACGSGMISAYYHCYRLGYVSHEGVIRSEGGSADIVIMDNFLTFSSKVSCVFTGICFA